ncbi:MAG: hypothetical protein ACU0AT_03560 [Tranquillimonas sp.]|jgi:hypothetical protein
MFRSVLSARGRSRTPVPPVPAEPALSPLEVAAARHAERLTCANAEILAMAGAPIIAVPICRTACRPGELSDFLIGIGTTPYARWNMTYYAADARAAAILDTHAYDKALDGLHDAPMLAVIEKMQLSWRLFRSCEPDADADRLEKYRASLRFLLDQAGAEVERVMFAGKRNLWKQAMGDGPAVRAA